MAENPGQDDFLALLSSLHRGVLATLKKDGRPQLSNVDYTFDATSRTIRISTTDDRAKAYNLRRDPRTSLHVSTADGWSYAVVEALAELSPVAADPQDATVEELVDVFRTMNGEHPDWDEYRAAMVADRRLVIGLRVDRAYGWIRPT